MSDSEYVQMNDDEVMFLSPQGAQYLIDWANMKLEVWEMMGKPDDDMDSDVAALILILAPSLIEAFELGNDG